MAVRFSCRVAVLIAAGAVYLPAPSDAAKYNKLERRGKAILQEKCGRCHAVEAVGDKHFQRRIEQLGAAFIPRQPR